MHHRFHFDFGRQGGGRGLGRFGKGFMDGGMGGRAFGMGRKLGSADLQLLILGLLALKPRHGYEIIKALDERSKGFYVPSPGMVYPALTYLEEIGYATIEAAGNRKLYHITTDGTQYLAANQARADALFAQFDRVGERMDHVRRAMDSGAAAASPTQPRCSTELLRARHELRQALSDKWESSPEEQQRVRSILERATADILSSGRHS